MYVLLPTNKQIEYSEENSSIDSNQEESFKILLKYIIDFAIFAIVKYE